jgi:hypothetical protein
MSASSNTDLFPFGGGDLLLALLSAAVLSGGGVGLL